MDPSFWLERWAHGEIGFHLPSPHPRLLRCWRRLGLAAGARVLVPLCGKTHDMDWLARQGHRVLGVELSEAAAQAFFAEHGRTPQRTAQGTLIRLADDAVEILVGDFFALQASETADIAAVYDRAALVALPAEMRRRYAAHLRHLLPWRPQMLVIGFDYDQARMDGPPFAVSEDELRTLYGDAYDIERVEAADILDHELRFRERGLTWLTEYAARLTARG